MAEKTSAKNKEVEINLPGTASGDAVDGELGQIRDLLFGRQAKETLDRLTKLERDVMAAIGELAQRVDTRLADLDARLSDLDASLNAEVDARLAGDSGLEDRLDQQAQTMSDVQIDLRASIDRRSDEFRKQLLKARGELGERIEKVDIDLREQNVERHVLANALTQAAAAISTGDQ